MSTFPKKLEGEIKEKQLQEEWEEENAKRKELNKPEVSYEEWIKALLKRFKPIRDGI